jgi:hypothetical protein
VIKITRTYERSSADILFYHEVRGENKPAMKHLYENYILTKKFVSHSQTMSDDKLKWVSTTTWATTDDFFDFSTDVVFARLIDMDASRKYEEEHNIILTVDIENI